MYHCINGLPSSSKLTATTLAFRQISLAAASTYKHPLASVALSSSVVFRGSLKQSPFHFVATYLWLLASSLQTTLTGPLQYYDCPKMRTFSGDAQDFRLGIIAIQLHCKVIVK